LIRKEKILFAALKLFANEGYDATSTSKIAKAAQVSEGLIFRHFTNKKGLLEAILTESEKRVQQIFQPIINETDPKQVLRLTIEAPYQSKKKDFDFWRLVFKLKWDTNYNNPNKMNFVLEKLTESFQKLGYKNATNEAIMLIQVVEAISISIVRAEGLDVESFKQFLFEKYQV